MLMSRDLRYHRQGVGDARVVAQRAVGQHAHPLAHGQQALIVVQAVGTLRGQSEELCATLIHMSQLAHDG